MTRNEFVDLMRLSVVDPAEGGRQLLAFDAPLAVRWMLLVATVLGSVVLLYSVPVMTGDLGELPSPFGFAATQAVMNVVVITLIAIVGRAFGGEGNFGDALWLMGWLQTLTAGLLILQIVAVLVLPGLGMPIGVASVALSIWVLVGYVCAVHGFKSRILVLVSGIMTFVLLSFALSVILLFLGYGPEDLTNV
ncbi:MAG: YIP1 family protein [Pararhodobacter sp.]